MKDDKQISLGISMFCLEHLVHILPMRATCDQNMMKGDVIPDSPLGMERGGSRDLMPEGIQSQAAISGRNLIPAHPVIIGNTCL